jgi:hypothetical protein
VLNSCRGPHKSCTGWQQLSILRFLLLVTAAARAMLAWIIIRGHALSWRRGELTAVIPLAALTFTVFPGVIDTPGSPPGEIGVDLAGYVAVAASWPILIGSIWRSREGAGRRKPPGEL